MVEYFIELFSFEILATIYTSFIVFVGSDSLSLIEHHLFLNIMLYYCMTDLLIFTLLLILIY